MEEQPGDGGLGGAGGVGGVGAVATAMDSTALAVPSAPSVTCTVKLLVPPTVGVPEMAPVAGFRERPPGRLPATTAQAYGSTPLLACSWAE